MSYPTFERPFPALTPAQRYHLEVMGYVVVENTLSPDEVGTIKEALYKLDRELAQLDDPSGKGARVRDAYIVTNKPHHHFIGNIIEADPAISAYGTHPRLVAMAEELIGGESRIVEFNAHINSRDPQWDPDAEERYGFHSGTDVPFATHVQNGLLHCNFVKTLTNLTDLGPDDGGTMVVVGSHKVDVPRPDLIELAYQDRSLIHQVVAPAGSTLLFSETLIHATGQVRSDNERVIIITGYCPRMFPYWDRGELSEEFKDQVPEQLETLIHGRAHWNRASRYRTLAEPVDERPFALGHWSERPPTPEEGAT
jgi:hypothetical protein